MTNRALANAELMRDEIVSQIDKLNQRLEEARKRLATVDNFIAEWHRFDEFSAAVSSDTKADTPADSSYPQAVDTRVTERSNGGVVLRTLTDASEIEAASRKNPSRTAVGAVAKDIITDVKRPVPREELFALLGARGVTIHGKDPQMVLSTMMWRMQDQFVRLPGHGYWLRDLPWGPAGYEPTAGNLEKQDEEEFDLMRQSIIDPGSMADVELPGLVDENGLPVAVEQYDGYRLRPQKSGAGWMVHIEAMNSSEPTRTTTTFSTAGEAIGYAKTILSGGARLLRRF